MSTPTTNYICLNGSGVYQDLSGIFLPLSGETPADVTGFKLSNNEDLNTIFAPIASSTPINFNTNFIAANGQDLTFIFAPK